MKKAAAVAEGLDSKDPAIGLQAVAALRRLLEQVERLQVDRARADGWLWQDIARVLGVSKQAVHAKHAARYKEEHGGDQ